MEKKTVKDVFDFFMHMDPSFLGRADLEEGLSFFKKLSRAMDELIVMEKFLDSLKWEDLK